MSGNIRIRQARQEDVSGILKCIEESYAKYIERIGRKPMPMLENYSEHVENNAVYVLEYEKKVTGVLVLINMKEFVLLDAIAVTPGLQGKSLGKKLLQFAEIYTRENGMSEIRLFTNEKMHENIEIYNHLGYIEYERKEENGYNRVFFVKKIPCSCKEISGIISRETRNEK